MPITSNKVPFPEALSAPFAGRGEWTFKFYGGILDGAASEQDLSLVLRRLDFTKWRINRHSTVLYVIHAIDRANSLILVAHSANPWVGG